MVFGFKDLNCTARTRRSPSHRQWNAVRMVEQIVRVPFVLDLDQPFQIVAPVASLPVFQTPFGIDYASQTAKVRIPLQ